VNNERKVEERVEVKTKREVALEGEQKREPRLRATCGKSLRCETEKRVHSIVSSHVHACVVFPSHTRKGARVRASTATYARATYTRLFFSLVKRALRDISQCCSDNIWKLLLRVAGGTNKLIL
jgi:hypothetical protein